MQQPEPDVAAKTQQPQPAAPQRAEAVRSIVTSIRTLYDSQEFNFAGPYGENGFLEDYTARVRGEEVGNVVLVTATPPGRRGASWPTTGPGRHCCSCPG